MDKLSLSAWLMLCECVYVERVSVCIFLAIKFRVNYDQTPL